MCILAYPWYAKTMRNGLLAYVAVLLTVLSACAVLAFTQELDRFSFKVQSNSRDQLIDLAQQKAGILSSTNQSIEQQVGTRQGEIKTTQAAIDKLDADLAKKLKELEAANKQLKAQQSQLSSSSDELNQLRARGADKPPLF